MGFEVLAPVSVRKPHPSTGVNFSPNVYAPFSFPLVGGHRFFSRSEPDSETEEAAVEAFTRTQNAAYLENERYTFGEILRAVQESVLLNESGAKTSNHTFTHECY